MTPTQHASLYYNWKTFWARPEQLAPHWDWRVWMLLAGRGFGKTRCGSEQVRDWAEGGVKHIILAGATFGDLQDIMIYGESGIMAISPPGFQPRYVASKGLFWPNGAKALCISAENPDRFRGKQCQKFWGDELAAWRYPDAWDQLMFGNRLGRSPQGVVTTTPRPTPLIKSLLYVSDAMGRIQKAPNGAFLPNPHNTVTRGSTYDNAANLAPQFLDTIISKYAGTRLGRQELHAEILDDVEGALWHYGMLDSFRVAEIPPLTRIVVGVDPNASNHEHSDEMGIITVGIGQVDGKTHGYVIGDASMRGSPMERGKAVIAEYTKHSANAIVPEVNQGGDMVEYLIKSVVTKGMVPKLIPVHASRGKFTRAEPVASLYEQGLIHHLGAFPLLEDELCSWVPGEDSPNRLDALVHGFTELFHLRDKPPAATGTRTPQVNIRARFGQGR